MERRKNYKTLVTLQQSKIVKKVRNVCKFDLIYSSS